MLLHIYFIIKHKTALQCFLTPPNTYSSVPTSVDRSPNPSAAGRGDGMVILPRHEGFGGCSLQKYRDSNNRMFKELLKGRFKIAFLAGHYVTWDLCMEIRRGVPHQALYCHCHCHRQSKHPKHNLNSLPKYTTMATSSVVPFEIASKRHLRIV